MFFLFTTATTTKPLDNKSMNQTNELN